MCVDFETDARLPLKIWVCSDGNAAPSSKSGKSSAAALWTGMLANVFGTSLQADVLCSGRLNTKTGCKLSVTYREGNMKQICKISGKLYMKKGYCFDYNNCTFDASVKQALSLVHTVHLSKLLFYLTSPWWQKKKKKSNNNQDADQPDSFHANAHCQLMQMPPLKQPVRLHFALLVLMSSCAPVRRPLRPVWRQRTTQWITSRR